VSPSLENLGVKPPACTAARSYGFNFSSLSISCQALSHASGTPQLGCALPWVFPPELEAPEAKKIPCLSFDLKRAWDSRR
jgi:hypothetical protein